MQTSNLSMLFSVYSFVSVGMLITDGVIGDIKGNVCNSCGFSTVLCTLAHVEFLGFLTLVHRGGSTDGCRDGCIPTHT